MQNYWINGFEIAVKVEHDRSVVLKANREGLLSLARVFEQLAADTTRGAHIHLDRYNALNDDSAELIVERIPTPPLNETHTLVK